MLRFLKAFGFLVVCVVRTAVLEARKSSNQTGEQKMKNVIQWIEVDTQVRILKEEFKGMLRKLH